MIDNVSSIMIDAGLLHDEISRVRITHVFGIPDNASAALYLRLHDDPKVKVVTVTREGEAFAAAAGVWIGGGNPLVLIQNTGLLESGDSVRGTVVRMRIPVLCLITGRGYGKMGSHLLGEVEAPETADLLSRPDLDSVALMTEPTLRAWGLPFDFLDREEELPRIAQTLERARKESRPWVLLIRTGTVERSGR